MSNLFYRRNKRSILLTIILLFSFSSFAFAAPDRDNERGQEHANYRDRDDDDDRWEHGGWNHGELRRRAISFGTRAGFEAGRRDRWYHRDFNFRDEYIYREASLGYRRYLGSFELYRRIFREAFARGYAYGYRSSGSRW